MPHLLCDLCQIPSSCNACDAHTFVRPTDRCIRRDLLTRQAIRQNQRYSAGEWTECTLHTPSNARECGQVCISVYSCHPRLHTRAHTDMCTHARAHTRAHAHRPKHVRHIVYSREVRADGKRSEPIRLSVFRKTSRSSDCPQGLYLHRKEPRKHVLLMDVLAISSCQLYSHSAQLSAARRWPSERESAERCDAYERVLRTHFILKRSNRWKSVESEYIGRPKYQCKRGAQERVSECT